jgi:hypothetical protein
MEVLKVMCFQSIDESITQTVEETLLLLIDVHVVGSVAG